MITLRGAGTGSAACAAQTQYSSGSKIVVTDRSASVMIQIRVGPEPIGGEHACNFPPRVVWPVDDSALPPNVRLQRRADFARPLQGAVMWLLDLEHIA